MNNIKAAKRLVALAEALVAGERTAQWEKLPKGWTEDSLKSFWSSMTGNAAHKMTQCVKRMEGKVDDAEAFCASLKDKILGTTSWRGKE